MRASVLMFAVLACLTGCGGGGGGGGSSKLSLALSPNPLVDSAYPSELPRTLHVNATVSGSTSASTVYVLITDGGDVFPPGAVSVDQTGPSTYTANLTTASDLTVGAHSASLSIRLCSDPSCRNVLATAGLPYTFTVRTPEVVSVGAGTPPSSALIGEALKVGITMQGHRSGATAYGRIANGSGVFQTGTFPLITDYYTGEYQLPMPIASTTTATQHTGSVNVQICGDSACAVSYGTRELPFQLQVFERFAGVAGSTGNTDGSADEARFELPLDLTFDSAGTLYVVDTNESYRSLRQISPTGVVTTLFTDGAMSSVEVDGTGTIFLVGPFGISTRAPDGTVTEYSGAGADYSALSPTGRLWVSQFQNGSVIEYTGPRESGTFHALGYGANLRDLVIQSNGEPIVCRPDDLVTIAADHTVTTLAPLHAEHLALEPTGSVLASDGSAIYRVTPGGTVSTLTGPGISYAYSATGEALWHPGSMALSPSGQLYVSDPSNRVILRTTLP